jgi:hypothetical protein
MKKTILISIISLLCLFNFSTAYADILSEGEILGCFSISNAADFPDYWFIVEEQLHIVKRSYLIKDDSCFDTYKNGTANLYAFKKDIFKEDFLDEIGDLEDFDQSTEEYNYHPDLQPNIIKSDLKLNPQTAKAIVGELEQFTINIVIDSLSENEFTAHIGETEKIYKNTKGNLLILLGISGFAVLIIIAYIIIKKSPKKDVTK